MSPQLHFVVILAGLLLGCSNRDDNLIVYAASSLTDVVPVLGAAFKKETGTSVSASYAGSHILKLQIENGAKADVFMSADASHFTSMQSSGVLDESYRFAQSPCVVISHPTVPMKQVTDLRKVESIAIGNADVPIGGYTRELFGKVERDAPGFMTDVMKAVKTEENSVRRIRLKVDMGVVDAGVVYRSDVASHPSLNVTLIPDAYSVSGNYGVAITTHSKSDAAARWVSFLKTETAKTILRRHQFEVP